jgi:Tol biopolymer transport system component/DNA-binding winged helix-turn-helix (wHTH) protein
MFIKAICSNGVGASMLETDTTDTVESLTHETDFFRFAKFQFDFEAQRLLGPHGEIPLSLKSAAVLACLIRRRGHVVSKDEILAAVWKGTAVSDDAIVQRVLDVRKALSSVPGGHGFIRTHPKRGYEFSFVEEPKLPVEEDAPPVSLPELPVRSKHRLPIFVFSGVAVAALVIGAVVLFLHERKVRQEPHDLKVSQLTFRSARDDYPAFDATGHRLLYVSDESGTPNIWLLDRATDERRQMTDSFAALSELDWSHDGEWIAYRSEEEKSGLYVRSLITGQMIFVSAFGHHPRWSPSGTQLAFHSGGEHGAIYIWSSQTQSVRRLDVRDSRLVNISWPVWTADDNSIYFIARVLNASSSIQHSSENLVSLGHQIWFLDTRGGPPVLSTPGIGVLRDGGFDYDRKNSQLVFVGTDRGLWRSQMTPKTGVAEGAPVRLTLTTQGHQHPRVGPQGEVAFSASLGQEALWSIPFQSDGTLKESGLVRLTDSASSVRAPALSPDGRHVAYFIWQGSHFELWMLDMETHTYHAIGPNDGLSRTSPGWSADGHSLTYTVFSKQSREVRRARLDDSFTRLVDEQKVADDGAAKEHGVFDPTGRYALLLHEQGGGESVLWLESRQGVGSAIISPGHYAKPSWSSDGRHIYFQSDASGWFDIWSMDFDPAMGKPTSAPRQISHFGRSPYLLSDNNLGFVVQPHGLVVPLHEDLSALWIADGQ